MTKQVINIGVEGNDATGDALRDAFRKVNGNFDEVYGIISKGDQGGLPFTALSDYDPAQEGKLDSESILITDVNGAYITPKKLISYDETLSIDLYGTDSNGAPAVVIRNRAGRVRDDLDPTLSGDLNAQNNFYIYNLKDIDSPDTLNHVTADLRSTLDSLAINKGYADRTYVNVIGDTMTGALRVRNEPGSPLTTDPDYDPTLTGNYLKTEAMQRQDAVYRGGDTMTGPLLLNADPTISSDPLTAVTKNYVDNNSFASEINFFVSSTGRTAVEMLGVGVLASKIGKAYAYAFSSINEACQYAEMEIYESSLEPGPYKQPITYNAGASYSSVVTLTNVTQNSISLVRAAITNYAGVPVDQGNPNNIDLTTGKLIIGENSGAVGTIFTYRAAVSATNDEIDIKVISGTFQVGENLYYDNATPSKQVTINVESGIYYEHLPIRVPRNVSIIGDEMRRTVIRAKDACSASPWANVYFYRDTTVDGLTVTTTNYGYHYMTDPTRPMDIGPSYTNAGNFMIASTAVSDHKTAVQTSINSYMVDYATANSLNTNFDQTLSSRDLGYIVDALAYDLKYGGNARSLNAAFKYYGSAISTPNKAVCLAGISHIPSVLQPYLTSAETGSYTAVQNLISTIAYAFDSDFNPPKNSKDIDLFLMNDATGLKDMTLQGHGGFAVVLDPEGQILTKSVYIQNCSSIAASVNKKSFRGGAYVDGFCGRSQVQIEESVGPGNPLTQITLTGLTIPKVRALDGELYRKPNTPTSFVVNGVNFRIEKIVSYNETTHKAVVSLNTAYTFTQKNITLETAGNRSMLATHFTQVNDLGYGVLATNNALVELVSVFTYYNHTAYYALNGAQIRAVSGSNSNGNFGLKSEGSDPNEIPRSIMLADSMTQIARVYKNGSVFAGSGYNAAGASTLTLTGFNYIPYSLTEVEVNHPTKGKTLYTINTVIPDRNRVSITRLGSGGGTATVVTGTAYSGFKVGDSITISGSTADPAFNGAWTVSGVGPDSTYTAFTADFDSLGIQATNQVKVTTTFVPTTPSLISVTGMRVGQTYIIASGTANWVQIGSTGTSVGTPFVFDTKNYALQNINQGKVYLSPFQIGATIQGSGIVTTGATVITGVTLDNYTTGGTGPISATLTLSNNFTAQAAGTYNFTFPGVNTQITFYISATINGSISGTTLTVNSVSSGNVKVGQTITGAGINGTVTITGGVGPTYTVSSSQNVSNITINCVYKPIIASKAVTGVTATLNTPIVKLSLGTSTTGSVSTFIENMEDGDYVVLRSTQNFKFFGNFTDLSGRPSTSLDFVDDNNSVTYRTIGLNSNYYDNKDLPVNVSYGSSSALNDQSVVGATSILSVDTNFGYVAVNVSTNDVVGNATTITIGELSAADSARIIGMEFGWADQNVTQKGFKRTVTQYTNTSPGSYSTITLDSAVPANTLIPVGTTLNCGLKNYANSTLNQTISSSDTITSLTLAAATTIVTTAIASVRRTTNVATIITTGNHNLSTGNQISISGVNATIAGFDVINTIITVVNSTTFTYANYGSDTFTTTVTANVTINSQFANNGVYTRYVKIDDEYFSYTTISGTQLLNVSRAQLGSIAQNHTAGAVVREVSGQLTANISTCRVTGHDFLNIGTGGYNTSNFPNNIYGSPASGYAKVDSNSAVDFYGTSTKAEVQEKNRGRVFFSSTNQDGFFRVGRFFTVDQGTGTVSFSASIVLTGLSGIGFKRGVYVSEFSNDTSIPELSDAVPTNLAVKTYINRRLGIDEVSSPVDVGAKLGPGFIPRDGSLAATGNINIGSNKLLNVSDPTATSDGANKNYTDTFLKRTGFTSASSRSEIDAFQLSTSTNQEMTSVAKNSGVVTVVLVSPHSLSIGSTVTITGVNGIISGFNAADPAIVTVTSVPTANSFTYARTGTNVTTTLTPGCYITSGSAISMKGNKIVNVATPTDTADAANKAYVDARANLSSVGDVLLSTPAGSNTLAYDSTISKWVNAATIGDVTLSLSGNTLTSTIGAGKITNSMLSASASIDQSKLSIDYAKYAYSDTTTATALGTANGIVTISFTTTGNSGALPFPTGTRIEVSGFTPAGYNGTFVVTNSGTTSVSFASTQTGTPSVLGVIRSARGLASFDTSQFSVTNGYTSIKQNGLSLNRLAPLPGGYLLGNSTRDTTGNVTQVSYASAIDLALPSATTTAGTGGVVVRGSGSNPSYNIIPISTGSDAGTIVQRDSNGNISLGAITSSSGLSDTLTFNGVNAVRIVSPGGGSYASTIAQAGAIKIKLPTNAGFYNTVDIFMRIKIYEDTGAYGGKSRIIDLGGNPSGSSWTNIFATQITQGGQELYVRFGNDSSGLCIYITDVSNLNTVWTNPQIYITEVQVGGSIYATTNNYGNGWNISIANSFDTIAMTGGATSTTPLQIGRSYLSTGTIKRTSTTTGYLDGNYQNPANSAAVASATGEYVAGTTNVYTNTSPGAIYTIGGGYSPTATSLGTMYGIGYAFSGAGMQISISGYTTVTNALTGVGQLIVNSYTPTLNTYVTVGMTLTVNNAVVGVISGFVSGTSGGPGTYTISSAVVAGSSGSPVTITGTGSRYIVNGNSATAGFGNALTGLQIPDQMWGQYVASGGNVAVFLGVDGIIYGTATKARYADLAENYAADQKYEPGTVLMIGGEQEVTLAKGQGTRKVAGVVSTNPAYHMNMGLESEFPVALALQGRVPCKVIGKISKGDMMVVSMVPGVAMASEDPVSGSIIGKALADYDSDRIGVIEVLVGKH